MTEQEVLSFAHFSYHSHHSLFLCLSSHACFLLFFSVAILGLCASSKRLHCSSTGSHLQSAELYSGRRHHSAYVQSLRGDPHCETKFSVLVSYRDTAYPLEIVAVDMLKLGNQSANRHQEGGRNRSSDSNSNGSKCGVNEALGTESLTSDSHSEVRVEPAVPPPNFHNSAPAPPPAPPATLPPLPPPSSTSSPSSEFPSASKPAENHNHYDENATEPKVDSSQEEIGKFSRSSGGRGRVMSGQDSEIGDGDGDGAEGAGLGDSWFVVGRPSPLLLEGLRTALLGEDTDHQSGAGDVRLICTQQGSDDGSHAQAAATEAISTTRRSCVYLAHAVLLAARSSVLRRELEARRNGRSAAAAVNPQIEVAGNNNKRSVGGLNSTSRKTPANALDTTSAADGTASTVVDDINLPFSAPLLEVVLEYLYLDRLTLVCDRAVRPDSAWLARPDLSLFAPQSRVNRTNAAGVAGSAAESGFDNGTAGNAEFPEGRAEDASRNGNLTSGNQRSSDSDSTSVEDLDDNDGEASSVGDRADHFSSSAASNDSNHDDDSNNDRGQHRQRLVQEWQRECGNWQLVLEECSAVLDAAKALDLAHLASLCLARLKRLFEPTTVAAVAACARRAYELPPLPISFGNLSNDSNTGRSTGSGDEGADATAPTPLMNVAAAPASDLIAFCAHYLVSHLDIALIAQRHQFSEKKSLAAKGRQPVDENTTGNESNTVQGAEHSATSAQTALEGGELSIAHSANASVRVPEGATAASLIASGVISLSPGGWLLSATLGRRSQAAQVVQSPKGGAVSIEPLATPLVPACNVMLYL